MTDILLVGSIHFHEQFHSEEPSDTFLESLQELREVLVRYKPTSIYIEKDYDTQEAIDDFYKDYDENQFYKDESFDVGFYVAKHSNINSVTAMDRMKQDFDTDGFGGLMEALQKTDHPMMQQVSELQEKGSSYDSNNLMDALHINNTPEFIDLNRQLYNSLITVGSSWEDAIPWLTWWSKRNMVMAHHIANPLKEGDKALVIVGSGHIYALEDILKATKKYDVINFNEYLK